MHEFSVFLSRRARKGLERAPKPYKSRLVPFIETLRTNPVPKDGYDVTKLSGSDSTYRGRLGPYRVLYRVGWTEKQVKVLDVDLKKDRTYK